MPAHLNFDHLRRYAVARSLFAPTTLPVAIQRLGFVQADPMRAPARAPDLMLRHRVKKYCAGDLEKRYGKLNIEEDFFFNYGFLPKAAHALLHPRTPRTPRAVRPKSTWAKAHEVWAFLRERGDAHPREVGAHFAHGKLKNWFGGSTNASTQLRLCALLPLRSLGELISHLRGGAPRVEHRTGTHEAIFEDHL